LPCWFDALGPATPKGQPERVSFVPPAERCEATETLWGDGSLSYDTASRVRGGAPISVVTLGSSVTCGAYVPADAFTGRPRRGYQKPADATVEGTSQSTQEAGDGRSVAWPMWLEKVLNSSWGARVHVTNMCRRGVGTEYWVANVHAASVRPFMEAADIILVEAAISDGGNEEAFRYLQPAKYTQLLAEYILALPRKPFVMWLTASWKGFAQHKAFSAEPLHLDVLAPLGISHTSMLRMFEPVEGRKDLADWLTSV